MTTSANNMEQKGALWIDTKKRERKQKTRTKTKNENEGIKKMSIFDKHVEHLTKEQTSGGFAVDAGSQQSQTQKPPLYAQQAAPQAQAGVDPGLGIFGRIGTAEVSRTGVYPKPGVYPVLYVDVVKMITSRNQKPLFTVEFLILDSNVPERPTGSKMTWQANMQQDAGPGNARAFLQAAMGCPLEEITPDAAAIICGEGNPAHGRLVAMTATMIKTKAGNDFTVCDWTAIPEEHQARAEELKTTICP